MLEKKAPHESHGNKGRIGFYDAALTTNFSKILLSASYPSGGQLIE